MLPKFKCWQTEYKRLTHKGCADRSLKSLFLEDKLNGFYIWGGY